MEDDHRQIRAVQKTFGPETQLGRRRTTFAERARHRRHRLHRGHGRARADHGHRLAEGLDPRPEGACRRSLGRRLQGRRHAEDRVLHARPRRRSWCSPRTARSSRSRPRSCRAGAASATRSGSWSISTTAPTIVAAVSLPAGAQAPRRRLGRARLRRAGRRRRRQYPQGQGRPGLDAPATSRGRCVRPQGDHVAVCGENRKLARLPAHAAARKWRAARACACSATRTAASPTPRRSRSPRA